MGEWKVSKEGSDLYDAWRYAHARAERLRQEWMQAGDDERALAERLAKWALPDDVKPGEVVGIWFGHTMVMISYNSVEPKYTVRLRPRVRKEESDAAEKI